MRVVVLGGTGQIGLLLIRDALAANYHVVVFARNPQKLPADIANNPAVTVIKGELLDADALSEAFQGADAIISALGPAEMGHPKGLPVTHGYEQVVATMRKHGIKRLIALGTASIKDANDRFSLKYTALIWGVYLGGHNAYNDIVAVGDVIRAADGIDWTLVRVPVLLSGESTDVHAGYVGDGKVGVTLNRAAFAAFVVGELAKNDWVKKAPLISSV